MLFAKGRGKEGRNQGRKGEHFIVVALLASFVAVYVHVQDASSTANETEREEKSIFSSGIPGLVLLQHLRSTARAPPQRKKGRKSEREFAKALV